MINTKFWSDGYIANIDPLEKLLFLYFITNPYTNICGVYEITTKQIALDTGIDKDNIEKVFLPRLRKAGKIYYIDGWVYIKNFLKHQKSSGNVQLGIKNGFSGVPEKIMAKIKALGDTGGSQGGHSPILEPELESKPEPKQSAKADSVLVNEIIELFREVNPSVNILFKRKPERDAVQRLLETHGSEKLRAIIAYLPKSNASAYAPTIISPTALERDLGKLIAWSQKQKSKLADKEVIVAFS